MSPTHKIMLAIINLAHAGGVKFDKPEVITAENIDAVYEAYKDADGYGYEGEFREGTIETDVPSEHSRHYESKSVAHKMDDGSWVGWTYWYGGGKHGDAQSIDWMQYAYDLDVTERQEMVTVRTWAKKAQPS